MNDELPESMTANAKRPQKPEPPIDAGDIFRKLGSLGPVAIASVTLPFIGFFSLLYYRAEIAEWMKSYGSTAMAIYIAVFAITSGLALAPTHLQAVLGGWLFGFATGSWAAMAGILGGALIGYVVAGVAAGSKAVAVVAEHKKSKAVYDALLNSGLLRRLGLVTLVRAVPSGFAMTNVALAAARIPVWQYLLCTAIGIAPRTIAAVWVGAQLTSITDEQPGQKWIKIGGIVVVVVTVMVFSNIANRALARVANSGNEVQ
ncbi:MAG: TVP38/TMEM64 family protein [Phycisphaerae bacterium]